MKMDCIPPKNEVPPLWMFLTPFLYTLTLLMFDIQDNVHLQFESHSLKHKKIYETEFEINLLVLFNKTGYNSVSFSNAFRNLSLIHCHIIS